MNKIDITNVSKMILRGEQTKDKKMMSVYRHWFLAVTFSGLIFSGLVTYSLMR